MTSEVQLRPVAETDLPIFYGHQRDPEAVQMAAFPARDREAFIAHWNKILQDETLVKQTVIYNGQVAGNIVSFEREGKREVGYWIGKQYWGKGIATKALALLLDEVTERPLFAYVAKHNLASRRVLEKCGFQLVGEEKDFSTIDGEKISGWILELRG